LIDYAGMYPPAELSFDASIRNYLRDRGGGDAWMLARFVCPAERLADFAELPEPPFGGEPPVRVSAVSRGGADADAFFRALESDLTAIAQAHERSGARVRVELLETRIPADLLASEAGDPASDSSSGQPAPSSRRRFLDALSERAARAGGLRVFLEPGFPDGWRDSLPAAIREIAAHPSGRLGVKLRCGGVTAAAFPGSEQVAFVICACRDAGASFKATAGLHHPVRSYRAEVSTTMHGFLNVFGAALLAHEHRLGPEEVARILEEEDLAAFRFSDEAFSWRDRRVSTEAILRLRGSAVTSFGSCSFDEPREDLRLLGILDPE
jgi:hypothetical protein